MPPKLNRPQGQLTPEDALHLAQQAPSILRNNPKAFSSTPLISLFSAAETPELWVIYENLLLSCCRTGDLESAHECVERLVLRFGDDNERVMALKGMVKEAQADNQGELVQLLMEYDSILQPNVTNIPVAKRRIALQRSMGKTADAIESLNRLLDYSPTDSEAWSELADIYLSQGLYSQAIFAMEEVLVLSPNAWNMHARLGEMLYMAACANDGNPTKRLTESLKRFSRSIELCDDYLRGYYGLKLTTTKLLKDEPVGQQSKGDSEGWSVPETETVQQLNELAMKKLAEIIRRNSAGESMWQGYSKSEVEAARELLEKESAEVVR